MTKFSIIITIGKTFDNLERCLNSIYTQTFKNYEIIAINYKNDDRLSRILERHNEKIKTIIKDDSTLAEAKNLGIDSSNGEYILFMNCNDCIEMNTLSILDKCTKNKIDIVRFQIRLINEKNKESVVSEISFKTCTGRIALQKITKYKYVEQIYTYLFNLKYVKDNNYKFEDRKNSDFGLIPYMIYNAKTVISIGDILYNHLIEDKISRQYADIKEETYDTLYFGIQLLDKIKDNNIDIKNYIAKQIILKSSNLKGEDYKHIISKIKEQNIINMLSNNKLDVKKLLCNINIKLAVRFLKW